GHNCHVAVEHSSPAVSGVAIAGNGGDASIVGMAGLFPGAASIDDFIALLNERRVVTGTLPEKRRTLLGLKPDFTRENPFYGGYLEDVEFFDHVRFKLSFEEARAMDPQLRKLLEVIEDAIVDSGAT